MKTEQIEAGILALTEPFTVREVADRTGGSPMRVKVALDRLVAQEKVVDANERHGTRGRAAELRKVA
jgi:predicted ArsR family transcriptional regulator